jgi:hypothetical protein
MNLFGRLSIKYKLMLIIMSVAVLAVGATALAISLMSAANLKQELVAEVELATDIAARQNKYLIQLGSQVEATENLSIFQARQDITRACLYDESGKLFAFYPMPDERMDVFIDTQEGFRLASRCPLISEPVKQMKNGRYEIFQHIYNKDERVGSVYVEASLARIEHYIANQLGTSLIVVLIVLPLATLLALWLQRQISEPVAALSDVASRKPPGRI